MSALVARAKIAVYHTTQSVVAGEGDEKIALAAALTNELFGEDPQPEHLEVFGLDSIVSSAQALLARDLEVQKLCVQSLRVANIIKLKLNQEHEPVGMTLLSKYGEAYPDAPTPGDFEILISEYEQKYGVENRLISEYEQKYGVENRPIPSQYTRAIDLEIEALRQEKPWYLWPSRIIFWIVVGTVIYWLAS